MKFLNRTLALIALSLPALSIAAENPFIGIWKPDLATTLENAKQAPGYTSEELKKMETILPLIISSMQMELTDATITMRFGKSREQTAPYTIQSATKTEVVIELQTTETQTIKATLKSWDKDKLSMQIEGNNDMDWYVWKPASSMEAEDPNMAAIVAGLAADQGASSNIEEVRAMSIDKSILNNLRQIASAADQYMLENGVTTAKYSQLEGEYFKAIKPQNGESYSNLVINSKDEVIEVTDKDGKTHTWTRR